MTDSREALAKCRHKIGSGWISMPHAVKCMQLDRRVLVTAVFDGVIETRLVHPQRMEQLQLSLASIERLWPSVVRAEHSGSGTQRNTKTRAHVRHGV